MTPGLQIKIMSELTHAVLFSDAVHLIGLSQKEVTEFVQLYNMEASCKRSQDTFVQQCKDAQLDMLMAGEHETDATRYNALTDMMCSTGWDPQTMMTTEEDATTACKFLTGFGFLDLFDQEDGTNSLLDIISEYGIDNKWYEVLIKDPEGFGEKEEDVGAVKLSEIESYQATPRKKRNTRK